MFCVRPNLHFITTKKKECLHIYIHIYVMSESPGRRMSTKTCPGIAHESPSSYSWLRHCQRTLRLVQATEVTGSGVTVLSDLASTACVHADEGGNEYALTSLSLVLQSSCPCCPTLLTGIPLSPHIVAISPPYPLHLHQRPPTPPFCLALLLPRPPSVMQVRPTPVISCTRTQSTCSTSSIPLHCSPLIPLWLPPNELDNGVALCRCAWGNIAVSHVEESKWNLIGEWRPRRQSCIWN